MLQDEDLIIYHDGVPFSKLNKYLISRQGLTDDEVEKVKKLHSLSESLGDNYLNNYITSKEYQTNWTNLQYSLQDLWKFPKNKNFHKFWEMKGCTCPKMDNNDNYPHGPYLHNNSCSVHKL